MTYAKIARRVIGLHYSVQCTEFEARAEVLNLQRKAEKGTRDDSQERLSAALEVSCMPLADLAREAYAQWATHIERT